jgi:DNA-binding MarR family transcriptional regulator
LDYTFLKGLIGLAEDYEQATGKAPELNTFIAWLTDKEPPRAPFHDVPLTPEGYGDAHTPGLISKLIVYMYRYAKLYIKKALDGTDLQSMDDFGYMVSLLQYEPMNKTELIQQNRQEKPTGMEIIKRLVRLGYIEETAHEDDRRSKVLRVSEKGRQVLGGLYVNMDKISRLILGNLNGVEQQQLVMMLQKLDDFHLPIFKDNLSRLDELLESKGK